MSEYAGKVECHYCNKPAVMVHGDVIYPNRSDLSSLLFWKCECCGAYVGTHKNSGGVPLGILANADLRKAKSTAHAHFDSIWRGGKISRKDAYKKLAEYLGIDKRDCHIGMFDVAMCKRVLGFKHYLLSTGVRSAKD